MADDGEDLVSQIKITGGDESAQQIQQLADKGSAAFDKLSASAKKADGTISKSTDNIAKGTQVAQKGAEDLGKTKIDPGVAAGLKNIEEGASRLSEGLPRLVERIGQFGARLTALGTLAAGAFVKLGSSASAVAKQVDGTSDSLEKNVTAQVDANNTMLAAETASINFASQQRVLNRDLATGKISYDQYRTSMQQARDSFNEQQRVAKEVAFATARVKEENDRLQKSLKDQTAYNQLIDKFGGPLLTSMTAFGRQVESIHKQFTDAFGPVAGGLIDKISESLSKNGSGISGFFAEASQKLDQLVKTNGPQIQQLLENLGAAAKSVFDGLIAAAPSVISFFNNQLAPAVKSVASFFTGLADTINKVFGTQITGGAIAFIALLLEMSGGIKLFFTVLKTGIASISLLSNVIKVLTIGGFGPWLLVIGAVVAALYILWNLDWKAIGAAVQGFIDSAIAKFNEWKQSASDVAQSIRDKFNAVVDFFQGLPALIGGYFTGLWESAKDLAAGAAQWVIDKWNAVVAFFQAIPDQLAQVWETVKQAITDAFQTAIDFVKGLFDDFVAAAMVLLQPLIDGINKVKEWLGPDSAQTGSGDSSGYSSGGHVQGPGTGTSDSIVARLSNNEFVVKASSVAKYGTGFMHAVNSGRYSMPKFAEGGLASISTPPSPGSFSSNPDASGGMQPLNLSLFGEEFQGLMMPEDVATRMTKFAISRQNRSAGRKPAWVGGGRS